MNREKVLFVCAENSARSQMAEAFFNHMAGRWQAESAGTLPASEVKPLAIRAMAEVGIDISAAAPKPLDLDNLDEYSRILSFGCIVKSLFPARERLEEWLIEDPGPDVIEDMRAARDDIKSRVEQLVVELEGSTSS
jgi:protein-tyrosine-phosphatase